MERTTPTCVRLTTHHLRANDSRRRSQSGVSNTPEMLLASLRSHPILHSPLPLFLLEENKASDRPFSALLYQPMWARASNYTIIGVTSQPRPVHAPHISTRVPRIHAGMLHVLTPGLRELESLG
ncbi:hypothetical protein E4U55_005480 [Claviceps digitariae]|nr:hypothetical protein E4U55_005480 [Claviceps digitariae]